MKTWLLLNLAVLVIALRLGGWAAVGGLLLVELVASVLLCAVFLYGLAGREAASKRRIRERMEELLWERTVQGIEGLPPTQHPRRMLRRSHGHPWRGPR